MMSLTVNIWWNESVRNCDIIISNMSNSNMMFCICFVCNVKLLKKAWPAQIDDVTLGCVFKNVINSSITFFICITNSDMFWHFFFYYNRTTFRHQMMYLQFYHGYVRYICKLTSHSAVLCVAWNVHEGISCQW